MSKKKITLNDLIIEKFGVVEHCALKMGVSRSTMYNYLKEPHSMQIGFFSQLTKALKVKPEELYKIVSR